MTDWRPQADIEVLKQRARILAKIREWFEDHEILEVDTPILGEHGVTDPQIHAFKLSDWFLQTSPEFFLKRLLTAGTGDIYQIARVFRAEESGRLHHHEFTLLEWYRLDFDDRLLANEVVSLIQHLSPAPQPLDVLNLSYADALTQIGVDLFNESISEYKSRMNNAGISVSGEFSLSQWREMAFSELIQRTFPENRLTVVFDYPADCAALARLADSDPRLAARFEVFWGSIELANGYFELRDSDVQKDRFESDNRKRAAKGLPIIPVDDNFLEALDHGLPNCAGVAMGLDRLVMKLLGKDSIHAVIAFSE